MKIQLCNFRSYDKFEIEIEEGSLTLLKGMSGSGKSTILQAIYWCLYGNIKGVDKKTAPTSKLHVQIEIGPYKIYRHRRPNLFRVEVGSSSYCDKVAQDIIDRTFGSRDVWTSCSYLIQGSKNHFFTLSPAEKADFIRKLTFSDEEPSLYISKVDLRLRDQISRLKILQTSFTRDLKTFTTRLEVFTKDLSGSSSENIRQDTKKIKDLEGVLNEKRREIIEVRKKALVYNKLIGIRTVYLGIIDENIVEEELPPIETVDPSLLHILEELYELFPITNSIPYSDEEIMEAKRLEMKRDEGIRRAKMLSVPYNAEEISLKIEKLSDSLIETLVCPGCETHLIYNEGTLTISIPKSVLGTRIVDRKAVEKDIAQLSLIEVIKEPLISYREMKKSSKVSSLILCLKDRNFSLNILEDKEALSEEIKRIKRIEQSTRSRDKLLVKIENKKASLEKSRRELKEVEKKIEELGLVDVEALEAEIELLIYRIKMANEGALLEEIRANLVSSQMEIDGLENSIKSLEELRKVLVATEYEMFSRLVAEIGDKTTQILSLLFEDPISFEITTEKTLKSDKEIIRSKIGFLVRYKGGEAEDLSELSGGEGDRVSLALTIALGECMNKNQLLESSLTPILLLDETLKFLDGSHKELAANVIRKHCSNRTVICVNQDSVEGYYDKIINF